MIEVSINKTTSLFHRNRSTKIQNCFAGKGILYIDNEYMNFLYFTELLKDTGAKISRAISLSQTLHKLKVVRGIKTIVISSSLSDNTFRKILKHIREKYPSMPLITILNDDNGFVSNKYLEAGSDACISKHTDSSRLIEALKEHMDYTT